MAKIGIAVIGAGAIATIAHLPSIKKISELELKAIVDIDAERASSAASTFEVASSLTDYHDALAMKDISAVVVCIPNYLHSKVTIDALEVGKHVLCEKPMATNLTDAKRMVQWSHRKKGPHGRIYP